MVAKEKIYREYDIRGVVGEDFDANFAYELGRAFAELMRQRLGDGVYEVAVGRDCRLSGEELGTRLIEGLCDAGMDVVFTGMGPTPQLYYSVFALGTKAGIQITGSHNPADQNGFKMMIGELTLSGADIQLLKKLVNTRRANSYNGPGGGCRELDMTSTYVSELIERSKPHMGQRKLRVVVDAGNGVGGLCGPDVLRGLGCEVIELYTEADGSFPNHHPDPTVLENIAEMRERVVSERADLGIAWDGDADRIGVVDENGAVIYGDMLLILYGRQLLKEVKKPIIIADVKCSEVLFSTLRNEGAEAVMWKTGHSLIKGRLRELNAHLAGEMSGHVFFKHRYYGFDDAIHASARLVEILSNSDKSLGTLLGDIPHMVSTPEIRVDCIEEQKFKIVDIMKSAFSEYTVNTLDGVRVTFPSGWGLVRASNTQPVLVMRFEADSAEHLDEYRKIVESRLEQAVKELG